MTEEEKKVFFEKFDEFIKETRTSFGKLLEDRQYDYEKFDKKLDEIYLAVGNMKNETHLLADKTEEQTKTVKKESKELKEHIEGNTKVVIKEVDKTKRRWWQVWKRKEVKNEQN